MMWEALREAVDEEMERDPTVCLMGEDVGLYGGSYKVTYDLYKKYGDLRLLDTPICENGFMGVGIGAAMTGLRVVIEGMNMGFLLLAYNQISNNAGKLQYTSGGQLEVPVVIRGPGGVGRQLGCRALAEARVVLPVDSGGAARGLLDRGQRQSAAEERDQVGQPGEC